MANLSRIISYLRSYGLQAIPLMWNRHLAHQKAVKDFTTFLPMLEKESLPILQEPDENFDPIPTKNIFFFWWDGVDHAPSVVKMNAKNLLKLYGSDYNVIFVDKKNYSSIVKIPNTLLSLFMSQKITIQTFSDILRCCLISKLGGVWIDSTVYLPSRIDFDTYLKKYDYFTLATKQNNDFLSYKGKNSLWSSFLIGAGKGNTIFKKMLKLYENYFSLHSEKPPYFIIDMFLMLLSVYNCYENCQERFGKENLISGDFSYLSNHFSSTNWENDVKSMGSVPQKLNWRIDISKLKKRSTIYHIYSSIMKQ